MHFHSLLNRIARPTPSVQYHFIAINFNFHTIARTPQDMRISLLNAFIQLPLVVFGTTAPPGCRKLNVDSDWPAHEVWEAALPGVIHGNGSDVHGNKPDYCLRVRNNCDVEDAVKFAAKHNIRLSVITTGHDQLGRSDAGSGLIIDLSMLTGVRVLESYEPTEQGVEPLDHDAAPNVIVPRDGTQAAVTFGSAVAGLALNYAVSMSDLYTMSGAAGRSSPFMFYDVSLLIS